MKICKHWTYTKKIRWRIRALWALLAGMLVYMFAYRRTGRRGFPHHDAAGRTFQPHRVFRRAGLCRRTYLQKQKAAAKQAASAAADESGAGRTQPVSARQKRRHCGGYPARHPALCHAHRVDVRHGGFLHGIFRAGRRHPSESCGVLVLQPSGR